ncbi:MAG: hypothetical protein EPN72_15145 [Nevskiaceae bacterium]|nr:MAG: hypothetical protein EPN72_15145 [Nevskiaceae bacterium]
MTDDTVHTDEPDWAAIDAADQADALAHIAEALWGRLPELADSPERSLVLGVGDTLLDDFAYLVYASVLDEDDAVACVRYLWQTGARVSWTDQGMVLDFSPPAKAIRCEGSGRFTARALAALMARADRTWRPRPSFPASRVDTPALPLQPLPR